MKDMLNWKFNLSLSRLVQEVLVIKVKYLWFVIWVEIADAELIGESIFR